MLMALDFEVIKEDVGNEDDGKKAREKLERRHRQNAEAQQCKRSIENYEVNPAT